MRLRLVDDSPDARSVGPIAVRGRTTLPSGARSRGLCAGPPTRRSDTRGRLRLPAGMHQIAPCARASCARLSETRGGLPLPAGMRGVAGCARLLGHGTVVPARVHGEGQGLLAEDGRRLQGGARMLPRLPRRARGRRQGRGRVRPLRARLLQNLDRSTTASRRYARRRRPRGPLITLMTGSSRRSSWRTGATARNPAATG